MEARGQSALAQVLSLVLLGDYASLYLSMLNQVEPAATDAIDFVKQSLAGPLFRLTRMGREDAVGGEMGGPVSRCCKLRKGRGFAPPLPFLKKGG